MLFEKKIRYRVIGVSIAMAFVLYLDRLCLSEIVKSDSFRADFNATEERVGRVLGAFFFTYALLQIPSGWLSDRFGARKMLTMYIVVWSLMTGLTGVASSLGILLIARLACGAAQAGAYPTSGGVIRRWFPVDARTRASSLVALGGRFGGTLAPLITALLIAKFYDWRPVLYLYCGVGLAVAWIYWMNVRDRPELHPAISGDELALTASSTSTSVEATQGFITMLRSCGCSRSLWLVSLAQLCVNIGWAFLVTWLPTFVKGSQQVGELTGAMLVTFVLSLGMVGQVLGGLLGDFAVQRIGLRWGRIIPTAIPALLAALAYSICPSLSSIWWVITCCATVSLMNDIANPSIWGIVQDIGGENTSAVYGWMNMWGNLGASLSSVMVPYLFAWGRTIGVDSLLVFSVCSLAYVVAALSIFGVDATKRIGTV